MLLTGLIAAGALSVRMVVSAEEHVDIVLPDCTAIDYNGNPLYNEAVDITINVNDMDAGIAEVEWTIMTPSNEENTVTGILTIKDGILSDSEWIKISEDEDKVTSVAKQVIIDGNIDDINLIVTLRDNDGDEYTCSTVFSIDTMKPEIKVTYDNQSGDVDYNHYYRNTRTATIVVKDRYFDIESANDIIKNTIGNQGTISAWKVLYDADDPDNSSYIATVTFDQDGRYALSYQCADRAGNISDLVWTPTFIIDRVEPEVAVDFDIERLDINHYDKERKAIISVRETNFDANRVSILGLDEEDYTISEWSRSGDEYEAIITFDRDGEYEFEVSVRDKAGNISDNISVPEFIIDLTKPMIRVNGIANKSANNGEVAPVISFGDKYIDKGSIAIELSSAKRGKIDISDSYTLSGDGMTYSINNIAPIRENDDWYTLKLTAMDLAGNRTYKEIIFAINRYGSAYVLGDSLKQINDKYVTMAKGVELTEENINNLKDDSLIMTLTVNGMPRTLTENEDYSVVIEENQAGLRQYKYALEDKLFDKDGSYILTLMSEDEAGNKNNNYKEDQAAEIRFGVDATAPIVAEVNFEANQEYNQNGMDLVVSVKDNMVLDNVAVYVNGQETDYIEDGEMYTFHMDEATTVQEVKIVARDAAGNETIKNYEGILIKGNHIVPPKPDNDGRIRIIMIVGLVLAGVGLATFFIIRKAII